MTILVDMGYFGFKQCQNPKRWEIIDHLLNNGAELCFDHPVSLRKKAYDWYKTNRGETLPKITQVIKSMSQEWQKQILHRYPAYCHQEYGLEGDDIIAIQFKEGDWIIAEDKDFLQIPGAWLVDLKMEHWGFEREQKKIKHHISTPERWLTWQLLHGDVCDTIPRTLFSKDRSSIPFIFSQEHPLQTALDFITIEIARASLDVLLLPTPLYWRIDSIQYAIQKYIQYGILSDL